MKIFASVFIAIAIVSTGIAVSAQTVSLNVGEWEPYTGEKLSNGGMAVEIVTAAYEAVGIKTEIGFVPWKRAEADVASGRVFASFPFQATHEREELYRFSDVMFTSTFAIAYKRGSVASRDFAYSSITDFKGYRIGMTAGTDAVKTPLEKAGAIVEESQTQDQLVKKLEQDRLDFIIDDGAVIRSAIDALYQGSARDLFGFIDKPFGKPASFRLMASKAHPDSVALVEKFNEGLEKIRSDGSYDDILSRYGLSRKR